MNAKVEDPMGVVSPDVEPDVECAIIDRDGCVAIVSLSHHNGCFGINRQAMFTIRVEDVPGAISWDDISELQLRLIYHRN